MTTELAKSLLILFTITSLSSTVGTLKLIFISKRYLKPVYITTFIDALIFGSIMKQITDGDSATYVLVFAVGKVVGAWIGDILDKKIALGILEVEIFLNNPDKMRIIADVLRDKGFSTETESTFGYQGKRRYKITVTTLRKEFGIVKQILSDNGYDDPTMKVMEVSTVSGKFKL